MGEEGFVRSWLHDRVVSYRVMGRIIIGLVGEQDEAGVFSRV